MPDRPVPGLQVLAATPDMPQMAAIASMRHAAANNAPLLEHDAARLQRRKRKMERALQGTSTDPELYTLLHYLQPIARADRGILQPAWAVSRACLIAWHLGLYAEVSPPVICSSSGFTCFAAASSLETHRGPSLACLVSMHSCLATLSVCRGGCGAGVGRHGVMP